MGDLLNTAISGLSAAQRQLATTSHNIANIDTPGYSRQRAVMRAHDPQVVNQFAIGKGVALSDIERIFDQFTTTRLRSVTSEQSRLDMFHQLASVIDDMLADSQGGISSTMQNFFSSVQDLANDPNSTPARIAMLDQASALTARFGYMDDRLNALQIELNDRTLDTVGEINRLATTLIKTNQDIVYSNSRPDAPADLLDRRDELLRQLSELVTIQAMEMPSGAVNVFLGQGQMLLSDSVLNPLNTSLDPSDPNALRVSLQSAAATVEVTNSIGGGELGGILEFRDTMIDGVRNGMGRLAVGISTLFNQQHREGIDQNGVLGTNFFSVGGPSVFTNSGNTGSATATAAVSNIANLTTDNYTVQYDGANWTLAREDGSSSVTAAGPTLVLDGVTVTIGGSSPASGDRFLVKPTITGAGSFAVGITRTELIAAASPIRTAVSLANTGDGEISSAAITNVADAGLLNPVTLRFNSPATTFDIVNTSTGGVLAASQAYTAGANIDYNGWRVQITGTPVANDTFTIEANSAGVADNTNALSLAQLQDFGVFDSGGTSIQEAYSGVVADVGSQTRTADINRNTHAQLKLTLIDRRESISGVNLDEEAANLIKFQHAYQAAAKSITVAQEIFQTLIRSF
jgi:flagellar hook-associated protein 1 FlgK